MNNHKLKGDIMKGKQIVNFLAYISIALIAVTLLVGKTLGWLIDDGVINIINLIAQIIAYTITAVYGFMFAKSKRNIGWMVAYIIVIIAIIVFTGLNFSAVIKG